MNERAREIPSKFQHLSQYFSIYPAFNDAEHVPFEANERKRENYGWRNVALKLKSHRYRAKNRGADLRSILERLTALLQIDIEQ